MTPFSTTRMFTVLSALLFLPVEADGALVDGLAVARRDELQADRVLPVGATGEPTRRLLLLPHIHLATCARAPKLVGEGRPRPRRAGGLG